MRLVDAETTSSADPRSNLVAARDIDAANALQDKMSAISEGHWCAGWLTGTEVALWEMLMRGADRHWGFREVDEASLDELRRLHEKAGGWWWWPKIRDALRFERTGRWVEIYEGLKGDVERT